MERKVYCVLVREVWLQPVYVLAESDQAARDLVDNGHEAVLVDEDGFESEGQEPASTWVVEEVKEPRDVGWYRERLEEMEEDAGQ